MNMPLQWLARLKSMNVHLPEFALKSEYLGGATPRRFHCKGGDAM